MLDASCAHSFFSRRHDGKIIGMETSLGWHGEDNGIFMINQDYKQSDEIKKQVQDFELQLLSGSLDDDSNYDVGAVDVELDMIADVGDIKEGDKFNVQVENTKT